MATGARDERGDALRVAQREGLRDEFADDQRQVRDGADHDGEGDRFGVGRHEFELTQPLGQLRGQRRAAVRAREDADQRDAHLDRRQELGGIGGDAKGGSRALVPGVGPLLQPDAAGGDDGNLRHREDAVEDEQHQDDDEFRAHGAARARRPDLSRAWPLLTR